METWHVVFLQSLKRFKKTWPPCLQIGLETVQWRNTNSCMKDMHSEAIDYDKNAIGVYRAVEKNKERMLVGHVPIELSSLVNNFLKANKSNKLVAKVSGNRNREVGLVVPAKFTALTKEHRLAKILDEELSLRKDKYTHFEITHVEKAFQQFPLVY